MATPSGTARFLRNAASRGLLHPCNIRTLGRPPANDQQLSVSAVGFGAYRVGGGAQEPQHMAALRAAFRSGVNVVDTSSHYSAGSDSGGVHGASEQFIGRAVAEAVEAGEVEREGLVLCTKLGHAAMGVAKPPGAIEIGPRGSRPPGQEAWHSIDPAFVEEEVNASKQRLGTSPDFVLLHNPEYFLSAKLQERMPIADAWDEMYAQLVPAFEAMEKLCDSGVIAHGYGVSANFLSCIFSTTGHSNVYEALVLDRVLDCAAAAAKRVGRSEGHRLRMVQLPLNPVENGAVLGRGGVVPEATDGDCQVAAKLGLPVITNRPLNSLPLPGVSSGDWGRNGATHMQLRDVKPMGTIESLLRRVLFDSLSEGAGDQPPVPLQQMALQLALSSPGVSCSLLGMRTEKYVEDAAAVLQAPPLHTEQVVKAYTAVREAAKELGCQNRGLW